jgi:hypothetical protein
MTILTNTFTTFDAKGIREDLSDAIYNISPKDTPLTSNAKKGQALQTFFEWQTDSLATAGLNAQLDGDDVNPFDAVTPTVRVGNYTQISRKTAIVSGTLEAVDKAGRKSEMAYQLAKKAAELKRDVEFIVLANQAAVAGSTTVARTTGSLLAWIKTNSLSAGNSYSATTPDPNAPVYTNVPTATRTDGSQTAFLESMLKSGMQMAYTQGGKPEMLMVGPSNKVAASAFTGVATKTFYQSAVEETAIIGAADVYVTDFGILAIVPNRFQRGRDAFGIDPEFVSLVFLRPYLTEPLAKTGDAEKRMILAEWGWKVHNEKAHFGIYDLTTP